MSHNYNRYAKFNRQRFSADFKRVHHNYERSVITLFQNALKAQIRPVIAFIKEYGTDTLLVHLDHLVQPDPLYPAYKACYTKIGVKHAEFTYKWINKIAGKKGMGFFSAVWNKLMNHFYLTNSAQRITKVTDTTKERIQKALADANDLNLSKSETATYLENQLKSDEFTRQRSLTIARTESTTAANQGAMLAADSTDYLVGKIWCPIIDMNTRPDHADMDGQLPIDLDDYFNVGGSLMMYPGDSTAPAKQVVNCRCSLVIVPLLTESGLPILKMVA